ncbi:rhodanese-like domain-containing protein [Hydrogenimonas sp.]
MKKGTLFTLLVLAAAVGYFLYLKGYILADFPSVAPKEAALLAKAPDVAILDVRTPEEYAAGHLRGARLVPVQRLERALAEGELAPLRDKRLLVYCRSGVRSVRASRILSAHDYRPVNLAGGINAWKEAGLPVER